MAQFGIDVTTIKGSIPSDLKLKQLSKLRPIILQKGLKIVNKMAPALIAQIIDFEDLCPPPSKLQQIINKRNNIVDEANQIATFLTTIVNALTAASVALGIIQTLISVVKIAKTIVQVVAGFIPLSPGAIPSAIGFVGDGLDKAAYKKDGSARFPPLKAKIDGLLIPLAIILAAISNLITVLGNLDGVLALCVTPIGSGNGDGGGEGTAPGEVLRGPVLKLKIENAGDYYENGTYENIKLKGGDGKGCRATIKVKKNKVKKVTVTEGGDGYSTQLFDPTKGFKYPNFLYVKKGKFGKSKLDVKELLETVDLKKRIIRKIKKKKVKGDGMLLSVEEIGASANSGGQTTGAFEVDLDPQGRIRNRRLNKGGIGRIRVTNRGGGYPNGTYTDVPLGNGAVGNIVITGGQLQDVIITEGGDGFSQGDGIEINIPPGVGAAIEVAESKVKFPSDLSNGQDAGGGNNTDPLSGGTIDGSGFGNNDGSNGNNIGTGAGTGIDIEGSGVGASGGSENIGSTGVGGDTGVGSGLSQNLLSGTGDTIVGSGLENDGGTGQASGGGFGTGANLSGGGINGGVGIGSGNNIDANVGQGGVPGQGGVGSGEGENGITIGGPGIGTGVTTGIVEGRSVGNGGNGYQDGVYDGQYLGGGSGNGLIASVTVENGTITGVDVIDGGEGYEEGDTFTIPRDLGLGGGDGITQDASLSSDGIGASLADPDTSAVDTNTGIVTATVIPVDEFLGKDKKLVAVLSGAPLAVIGPDGEQIPLPSLTGLDQGLVKLVALTQQAVETDNDTSYKGFVIEIEERKFNEKLTQRRAVAFNPSGIVVAATEFSFATDEGVLTDDVKLIIDEQNLRITFEDLIQVTSIESEVALPNE